MEEVSRMWCRSSGVQVAPVVFCPKKPVWPRLEEIPSKGCISAG